eukprot:3307377-Amphidinium_carterae.1
MASRFAAPQHGCRMMTISLVVGAADFITMHLQRCESSLTKKHAALLACTDPARSFANQTLLRDTWRPEALECERQGSNLLKDFNLPVVIGDQAALPKPSFTKVLFRKLQTVLKTSLEGSSYSSALTYMEMDHNRHVSPLSPLLVHRFQGFLLSDGACRVMLRQWLHVPVLDQAYHWQYVTGHATNRVVRGSPGMRLGHATKPCGQRITRDAAHVQRCYHGPCMARHHALRDEWIQLCREAAWHTQPQPEQTLTLNDVTIAGDVKHCTVDYDVLHSLHRASRQKMHKYSVSTDAPGLTSGVRVVPLIHGEGGYMGEAAVELLQEISAAVASREETLVDAAPGTRLQQIQLGYWSRLR